MTVTSKNIRKRIYCASHYLLRISLSSCGVNRGIKYANCIWHVRVMNDRKVYGTPDLSLLLRVSHMNVLSSWRNRECYYVYRRSLISVAHNDTDKSQATLIVFNSALIIQNDFAMFPALFILWMLFLALRVSLLNVTFVVISATIIFTINSKLFKTAACEIKRFYIS